MEIPRKLVILAANAPILTLLVLPDRAFGSHVDFANVSDIDRELK
jgi:hypothetical protein